MQCLTYCIASQVRLSRLDAGLKQQGYRSEKLVDVLQLSEKNNVLIFIFSNGTVVAWGVKKNRIKHYLELVKPYCEELLPTYHHDGFIYRHGEKMSMSAHPYFNAEILTMETMDEETKLALSYAFSQSIKLRHYESINDSLSKKYSPVVHDLSEHGHIKTSRREIRKITGEILAAKSLINLQPSFMYQPKFFWKHPNLESEYLMLRKYLDISERVEVTNHQLNSLNEIFTLLSGYLEDRHSHFLEVIIIVLISVEIVFSFLHLQL